MAGPGIRGRRGRSFDAFNAAYGSKLVSSTNVLESNNFYQNIFGLSLTRCFNHFFLTLDDLDVGLGGYPLAR